MCNRRRKHLSNINNGIAEFIGTFWLVSGGMLGGLVYRELTKNQNG
jgi:glycerol uptake facilitator-like aquaporin